MLSQELPAPARPRAHGTLGSLGTGSQRGGAGQGDAEAAPFSQELRVPFLFLRSLFLL